MKVNYEAVAAAERRWRCQMQDEVRRCHSVLEKKQAEIDSLRAYFDAHMAMHAAIDADKFAAAYVKANQARDRLLQMSTPAPELNCDEGRAGGAVG